jgi:lysyl-tRNA synthetase class 2
MNVWRPSADIKTLKARAKLLQCVRHFFDEREIIEVETPALSLHSVTDPYLKAFSTIDPISGKTYYLQTSPEYAMKRLLCAGMPSIFYLGKAYRAEEKGRLHNAEFTMLEWYHLDFAMQDLIDEVIALINTIVRHAREGGHPWAQWTPAFAGVTGKTTDDFSSQQFTYQAIFEKYCHFDPLSISITALKDFANQKNLQCPDWQDKDEWLMYLFSECIEPQLITPTVVTHFPASQAALAQKDKNDPRVALRFEVYIQGIELANGFQELSDPIEQRARFEKDNRKRETLGFQKMELDERLLSALESGLPECSGVALGLDRLFMLALHKNAISEVMAFTSESA